MDLGVSEVVLADLSTFRLLWSTEVVSYALLDFPLSLLLGLVCKNERRAKCVQSRNYAYPSTLFRLKLVPMSSSLFPGCLISSRPPTPCL